MIKKRMNQLYIFAIASILATASLMAGTFTVAAFAQAPTDTPEGDMGSTMGTESSNMTGGNMTIGTDNSTTTTPM